MTEPAAPRHPFGIVFCCKASAVRLSPRDELRPSQHTSSVAGLRQVVLDVTAEARARVRRGCVPAAFSGHLHAASVRHGDQLCGWRGLRCLGLGFLIGFRPGKAMSL